MKIAVIGQGYVGLPLAVAAAKVGHSVIGIDLNLDLVALLNEGISPISDISNECISEIKNNYQASTDFNLIKDSEIVAICVPTPLDAGNNPDNSYLLSALNSVAANMKSGALVIIESTISPGTTRNTADKILKESGKAYELAYSPERIDPANKQWNISNTPKLVAGLTPEATKRASDFYKTFIKEVVVGESVETFETAKLLENTFRLINISFINEFADFCQKMGIDVREVIAAASTKPYGFMPFLPGAGVGGHCIPVDPTYLSSKAKEIGASTKFIDLANQVNHSLGDFFTRVAENKIGPIQGKKVLLIGIAYKPNVADVRETPAQAIYDALKAKGAEIYFHDSLISKWNAMNSVSISNNFDLAILINPHTGTDLDALGEMKVLDTRGGY